MDWEFGVGRRKQLHLEWINNKVILYSTGNYIQSSGINPKGKQYFKRLLCCTADVGTTLQIYYASIKKKKINKDSGDVWSRWCLKEANKAGISLDDTNSSKAHSFHSTTSFPLSANASWKNSGIIWGETASWRLRQKGSWTESARELITFCFSSKFNPKVTCMFLCSQGGYKAHQQGQTSKSLNF